MRQKRAKAYKRVMALYVSTFGFRTPYQVLLSDGFLLESAKQKDIDSLGVLRKVLGGADVKFMITQCCMEALYKLGREYQGVVNLAKSAERRKCNHREAKEPTECIQDVVGETNKHRYVLCLSSQKFQARMAAVPGLPVVHYNSTGVMVLSPPSQATVRVKNAAEEERRLAGAAVLDGVVDGANVKGAQPIDSTGAAASAVREAEARSRRQGPKAPNPLSMRKKKRKAEDAAGGRSGDGGGGEDGGDGEGEEGTAGKKKRRKRGRGKGAVAEAIEDLRGEQAQKIAQIQALHAAEQAGSDDGSDSE